MLKIYEVSDFSDLQSLEKMQKLIRRPPKCFANCELRTANSNPVKHDTTNGSKTSLQ